MTDLSCLDELPILFDTLKICQLSHQQKQLIAQIDNALPQTQCGLCGHIDGCLPYAYHIVVHGKVHNLCVPGGQAVTDTLYQILRHQQNTTPLSATPSKWQTNPATNRPIEVLAVINETDCIGCTKCIPACPVDAIVGSAKHMHSIISELCTGCELCLPPCPVDCISLVPNPNPTNESRRQQKQTRLRQRYHHHLNRMTTNIAIGNKPVVSAIESALSNNLHDDKTTHVNASVAKNTIELAKLRTQIKKLSKQLAGKDSEPLRQKLAILTDQLTTLQNHHENSHHEDT